MDPYVISGIATSSFATATSIFELVFPLVFSFAISVLLVFVVWRLVKRGVRGG